VPFALGNQLFYPAKKSRVVLLDVLVEESLVVVEDEPLEGIAEIGGCSEGG